MRRLLWTALLAALVTSCGGGDLVELRLYPCTFGVDGKGLPMDVKIVIDSYDESGAPVETGLTQSFRIDDPAMVFADGFATVGYKKTASVRTADFTITWSPTVGGGPDDQTIELAGLAIPDPGGSVELKGDELCGEVTDTEDTSDMSTDPTTQGTATTTDSTQGTDTATTDTDTASTTASTTDPTTDTETDTDTATTDSTTETDTDTATTDPTTDTDTDTETETDTEEMIIEPVGGEPCDGGGPYGFDLFCWTDGYGSPGTIYQCDMNTMEWKVVNKQHCDSTCTALPDEGGVPIGPAMTAGCSGNGGLGDFDCLCYKPMPCPEPIVACEFHPMSGKDQLLFCDGNLVYNALCSDCLEDVDGPVCGPNPTPPVNP